MTQCACDDILTLYFIFIIFMHIILALFFSCNVILIISVARQSLCCFFLSNNRISLFHIASTEHCITWIHENQPMKIIVLFFASCREQSGTNRAEIEITEGSTTADLVDHLLVSFPGLAKGIKELSMAVNKKYIREIIVLADGDEVALLPPISGG
jgi:molybdopterin converting factor subunit 1